MKEGEAKETVGENEIKRNGLKGRKEGKGKAIRGKKQQAKKREKEIIKGGKRRG